MTKHLTIVLLAVLLIASLALAQDAAPLTGTITFRGGEKLTGTIKEAYLGIMEGTGVGTALTDHGSIKLQTGAGKQVIPATNIALIEAAWVDKSTPTEPSWEIEKLTITTRDGKVLTGKPDWHMHATNVSVLLASGETKRVHAFPLGSADFSADNLIATIELGAGAAAPAEGATTATPAETTPAETTPAETTPAEMPAPTTTPAETTPAETTPAETTPAPTTAATPAETTPPPTTAAVAAAAAAQATNVPPGQPVVIKVPIAGTNKVANILIYVNITEEGIEVMPPAQ